MLKPTVLRGTLASQLMFDAQKTDDPELKKELERQKAELQQRAPRGSVAIRGQLARPVVPRLQVLCRSGFRRGTSPCEKGRRRAILKRKSGVADRAWERTHLDVEWHKKHEPFKTGSKRHDVEGLKAELEIDDRRRDLRQAFGASQGSRNYELPG